MERWKLATALLCLFMASSCTTAKLEELRQISPQGTPFQMALTREYLAYSDAEAKQYDWIDSYHFADKGLRVAYGQDATPENPRDWDIDAAYVSELEDARKQLLEQFTPENLTNKAETAARAQMFYDCWVEQQEENWQTEDIAACKHGFLGALEALREVPPIAEVPQDEPQEETPVMRTTSYMLFFDHDDVVITKEGHQVLQKVIEDIQTHSEAEILLHGHADASGTENYNMSLSERRAQTVRNELIMGGVAENRITYYAFGETDLRVPTADGIREPGNRRVEIFLE